MMSKLPSEINRNVPVFPRHVHIETINKCNLKCVMCPISAGENKRPAMPFELYEKAIRECAQYKNHIDTVGIYLMNEPLMDKSLPEKIALAKAVGVRHVHIATNAELLTEDRIDALIDAGIDLIILSIESLSSAVHETIRIGSHLETIKNNVDKLFSIKKERRLDKLQVEVRMLAFPENKGEWEAYAEHWLAKGATSVGLQAAHNWGGQFANIGAENVGINACNYLWTVLVIQSDGNVCLCCLDPAGEFKLGNIKDESIHDIWHGEKYAQVRMQFEQRAIGKCVNCNWSPGSYIVHTQR